MRVGVIGASGYAGAEVLRICASHPDLDVVIATGESNAGRLVAEHIPALAGAYPSMVFEPTASALGAELDVVFLALPHGQSQRYVPDLIARGVAVVDLGADFRLKNPADYVTWYGESHRAPELLASSVYGLVERHRHELVGARLIAVPGCYPTASSLALGPFVDRGLVATRGIVVNALSAGRATSDRLHFSRLAGSAEAYSLVTHRHTPEIEQEIHAELIFTPHLVPVSRGMLVSAYAPVATRGFTSEGAMEVLLETYANDPFIVVSDQPPTLKDPVGSNLCFVSARVDPRTGWLLAMSSLDR
jgi:N-acetyl-gamma-glutamyl-phosphate reductase